MVTTSTLIPFFDDAVVEGFQEDTLRCLFQAYRDSELVCRELYHLPEFRRDTIAFVRRTLFDDAWIRLVRRYPSIEAYPAPNASKNCSHACVEVPEQICWTASLVDSPGSLVRPAMFREEYAQRAQGDLFIPEEPERKFRAYAILLHGHDADDLSQPRFVWVAFPDRDCSMYFTAFDLRDRFPHVGTDADRAAAEQVDEHVAMRVRDQARERI